LAPAQKKLRQEIEKLLQDEQKRVEKQGQYGFWYKP